MSGCYPWRLGVPLSHPLTWRLLVGTTSHVISGTPVVTRGLRHQRRRRAPSEAKRPSTVAVGAPESRTLGTRGQKDIYAYIDPSNHPNVGIHTWSVWVRENMHLQFQLLPPRQRTAPPCRLRMYGNDLHLGWFGALRFSRLRSRTGLRASRMDKASK